MLKRMLNPLWAYHPEVAGQYSMSSCFTFFQVSFKKNYEKKFGILLPSIDRESVSPFSLTGDFHVTHCILCAVISTNPISRQI